jgi:hypothetical protein
MAILGVLGAARAIGAGAIGASMGAGRAAGRAASQIASPITQPIGQFARVATSPLQTMASLSPAGSAAYDVAQSAGRGFSSSFSASLSKGTGKEPLIRVLGFEALLDFMKGQQESDQQRVRAESQNKLAGIEAKREAARAAQAAQRGGPVSSGNIPREREFKLGGILKWAAIGTAIVVGLKKYFESKAAQDAVGSLAKVIIAPLLGAISSTASTIFSTLLSELDPSKWLDWMNNDDPRTGENSRSGFRAGIAAKALTPAVRIAASATQGLTGGISKVAGAVATSPKPGSRAHTKVLNKNNARLNNAGKVIDKSTGRFASKLTKARIDEVLSGAGKLKQFSKGAGQASSLAGGAAKYAKIFGRFAPLLGAGAEVGVAAMDISKFQAMVDAGEASQEEYEQFRKHRTLQAAGSISGGALGTLAGGAITGFLSAGILTVPGAIAGGFLGSLGAEKLISSLSPETGAGLYDVIASVLSTKSPEEIKNAMKPGKDTKTSGSTSGPTSPTSPTSGPTSGPLARLNRNKIKRQEQNLAANVSPESPEQRNTVRPRFIAGGGGPGQIGAQIARSVAQTQATMGGEQNGIVVGAINNNNAVTNPTTVIQKTNVVMEGLSTIAGISNPGLNPT